MTKVNILNVNYSTLSHTNEMNNYNYEIDIKNDIQCHNYDKIKNMIMRYKVKMMKY